jgi:hypothetical protein
MAFLLSGSELFLRSGDIFKNPQFAWAFLRIRPWVRRGLSLSEAFAGCAGLVQVIPFELGRHQAMPLDKRCDRPLFGAFVAIRIAPVNTNYERSMSATTNADAVRSQKIVESRGATGIEFVLSPPFHPLKAKAVFDQCFRRIRSRHDSFP